MTKKPTIVNARGDNFRQCIDTIAAAEERVKAVGHMNTGYTYATFCDLFGLSTDDSDDESIVTRKTERVIKGARENLRNHPGDFDIDTFTVIVANYRIYAIAALAHR